MNVQSDATPENAPASNEAGKPEKKKKKAGPGFATRIKNWFGKGRFVALILLGAFLFLRNADPYPVEFLRLKVFDIYQWMKPREVTVRPVTIVDLDEDSLAEIGQWPWARTNGRAYGSEPHGNGGRTGRIRRRVCGARQDVSVFHRRSFGGN